jgi:hypothetical protein
MKQRIPNHPRRGNPLCGGGQAEIDEDKKIYPDNPVYPVKFIILN